MSAQYVDRSENRTLQVTPDGRATLAGDPTKVELEKLDWYAARKKLTVELKAGETKLE